MLSANLSSPRYKKFTLDAETVADAIAAQLHSGYGGVIILPERYWFLAGFIRAFPSWIQEGIRNGMAQDLAFLGDRGKSLPGEE